MATRSWTGSTAALLGVCLALACGRESSPPAPREGEAATSRVLYVLSPDGAFAKVDLASSSVAGTGSLRDAGVAVVEGIVPDPERRDVVIRTSRAWSPDAVGPGPGLVIVRAVPGSAASPRMERVEEVAPPPGMDRLVGALLTPGERRLLVTTWVGPDGDLPEVVTLVAEDGRLPEARRIDGFGIGAGSCAAADGSRVFSTSGRLPLETRILETRDLTVRSAPSQPADWGGLSPILVVASRAPCRVLIVGRAAEPAGVESELPAVLYDPADQKVLRTLTFEGLNEYALSPDGSLVVADARTVVPNVLPDGTTVGVRYQKTGVLRVYAAATGRSVATARLPEDGTLSAIEGSTGYYVSPRTLSVVDLENGKVTATVELPFASGFVAFHDGP